MSKASKDFSVQQCFVSTCPVCDQTTQIEKGFRKDVLNIRDTPVKFTATLRRCSACGEYFSTTDEEEVNFATAYTIYREKKNLLKPEEIKSLRERYGLSQRAFGRILGWGEITLHRYEHGALQDDSHNNELVLLRDPKTFKVLFERNRHKLIDIQQREVEKRLAAIIGESEWDQFQEVLQGVLTPTQEDISTGYRLFDSERFENLVSYICWQIPYVTKTKLNRLLWYCDFVSFRQIQRSITGLQYVHVPYGPVPKHYEYHLASLMGKWIESEEFITREGILGEKFRSLCKTDLSIFSSKERKLMTDILKTLKHMSASEIVALSHEEEGYKNTQPGEVISYKWAKDLKLNLNP